MLSLPRVAWLSSTRLKISNSLVSNADDTICTKKNSLSSINILSSNVDKLLFISVNLFLGLSFKTNIVARMWSCFLQNLLLLESQSILFILWKVSDVIDLVLSELLCILVTLIIYFGWHFSIFRWYVLKAAIQLVANAFSTIQIAAVCSKPANKITYLSISDSNSLLIILNNNRIIHILLLNMLNTSFLWVLSLNLFVNGREIVAFPRRQDAHIIDVLRHTRHIEIVAGAIEHVLVCLEIASVLLRVVAWISTQSLETIVHVAPWLEVLLRLSKDHTLIVSFLSSFIFLTSFRITSTIFFWLGFVDIQLKHLLVLLTTMLLANDEISLTGSSLILNLNRNLILLHLCLSNLLLLCRSIRSYTRVKFSIFWISKLRNLIGNVIWRHVCVIEHFWWILRTWLSCSSSMTRHLLLKLKLLILHFTLINLNFIWNFVLCSGHWMFLSNFLTTA